MPGKSFSSKWSFLLLVLSRKWNWKYRVPCHFYTIQKTALHKTREFHFSFVWVMEFCIISSCLAKIKILPIIQPSNLSRKILVQRLHEKCKWFLCLSDGAEWLSVCLRTKKWDQFLWPLLKCQILHLFRARSSLTFRQLSTRYKRLTTSYISLQLQSVHSLEKAYVTWSGHTIKNFLTLHTVLLNYFICSRVLRHLRFYIGFKLTSNSDL